MSHMRKERGEREVKRNKTSKASTSKEDEEIEGWQKAKGDYLRRSRKRADISLTCQGVAGLSLSGLSPAACSWWQQQLLPRQQHQLELFLVACCVCRPAKLSLASQLIGYK